MIEKSPNRTVNYDEVAHVYDERYKDAYKPEGLVAVLSELARETGAERILEVGCGTGHLLAGLQNVTARMYGMDLSHGMLQKARARAGARADARAGRFHLVRGDVGRYPFPEKTFDMIVCVNALHHFRDPPAFVHNVPGLLRQGGALSVTGMDPRDARNRWFLYDYFPGTYETDLERYPSTDTVAEWMDAAGFENIRHRVGERILVPRKGREILPLDKNFTSQLTLLTPEAYNDGIERIEAAVTEAEASGTTIEFVTDVSLVTITGWMPQ